jgi:hypothetical protein
MSKPAAGHDHDEDQGVAFNWFGVLDALVWAAIMLLVILGVEYFAGLIVREKISRGAQRHLAQQEAQAQQE